MAEKIPEREAIISKASLSRDTITKKGRVLKKYIYIYIRVPPLITFRGAFFHRGEVKITGGFNSKSLTESGHRFFFRDR